MKFKITILGKVQNFDYMIYLLNKADSLKIENYDTKKDSVCGREALRVFVEGSDEQIGSFVRFLKNEQPSFVEEIQIEEYDGSIRTIDSYRFVLGLEILNELLKKVKS